MNVAYTKETPNELGLIYCFAALASFLLSAWIAYREVLINPDAICYLQSAAVIGAGGLRKAMNLCPQAQWPLYSVLIYSLSFLTQLPLLVSAFIWDALFSAISVMTFIAIVRELGGHRRVLWLSAWVILLAHQFNSIRQYLIRDHGFLAFYLLSLYLLLRYVKLPRWTTALAWGASLLLATLFRIEGAVFLVLIPWLTWFMPSLSPVKRTKAFLQLNLIALACGLTVFGWLIFHPEISLASLGRLQDLVFQLFHAGSLAWQRFEIAANAFGHSVLAAESMADANLVFSLSVIMWYAVRVLTNLSLIYSGLVIYAWWRRAMPSSSSERRILAGYIAVNILVTSVFLAQHLFLSKRYLIALSLVFMLWVPFALDRLIRNWENKEGPAWLLPLCLSFWIISSLGGIFDFGYSKIYMRHAGDWLAENLPGTATLYSNDYQLMYYSQHFGNDIFQKVKEYSDPNALRWGRWKNYDYIALRLDRKTLVEKSDLLKEMGSYTVQIFKNKRNDQVVIYKIKDST